MYIIVTVYGKESYQLKLPNYIFFPSLLLLLLSKSIYLFTVILIQQQMLQTPILKHA